MGMGLRWLQRLGWMVLGVVVWIFTLIIWARLSNDYIYTVVLTTPNVPEQLNILLPKLEAAGCPRKVSVSTVSRCEAILKGNEQETGNDHVKSER